MIYNSSFKDINDSKHFVTIQTNTGSLAQRIELSGDPFTVSMKGDESNLYKPARYSGATVGLLVREAPFDVYSAGAHDTKVTLQDSTGNVEWTGWATPCAYSQGWDTDLEELDLECVDGLSTLENIKFESDQKSIVTFRALISKLLRQCECYTAFYFPAELKEGSSEARFLDCAVISEANFFDDKKDDQEDEDVAWKCKEVLEELCRYMGVTATAIGEEVWFLDYDALKTGRASYHKYSISGAYVETVSKTVAHEIRAESYSETGTNISLGDVYNKITVKSESNKFDSLFPSPFDNAVNITAAEDPGVQTIYLIEGGYGQVIQNENTNVSGNHRMEALLDKVWSPDKDRYYDQPNFIGVQYVKPVTATLHRYDSTLNEISYPEELCFTDTKSFLGGIMCKMDVSELKISLEGWLSLVSQIISGSHDYGALLDTALSSSGKSKVDLSDYIILIDREANPETSDASLASKPFVEYNSSDTACMFGGNNSGIIISGSYSYHEFPDDPYPIPDSQVDLENGRKKATRSECYLVCKLKWGSLWWNGTEWTNTNSWFTINWLDPSEDNLRADNLMFRSHSIPSTVSWRAGISDTGYYIPAPEGAVLSGTPEFTICRPKTPHYQDNKHVHKCVFIKDLKLKAVVGDPTWSGANKTDTCYTNVISSRFVTDFDEISFKVCTNDDKNPALSSVGWLERELKFLGATVNSALESGESTWNGSGDGMRQEEHLIYRLSNQYSTPAVQLDINLKLSNYDPRCVYRSNTANCLMVVDSASLDYRNLSAKIKLIEKK